MAENLKGLRRIPDRGVIAGVCAGIAEYFDWSPKVVRVVAVVLLFIGFGTSIIVYLALWYVIDPVAPAATAADPSGDAPSPGRPPSSKEDVKARFARLDERLRAIEECVTDKAFELRRASKKLEA